MDENRNTVWYNTETDNAAAAWYAHNFTPLQTPSVAEAPKKKKRKARTGLIVILVVVVVLGLVAGSALYFAGDYSPFQPELSLPDGAVAPVDPNRLPDSDFGQMIPDFDQIFPDRGESGEDSSEDEMPENFQDFFNNYFTMEDTIEPSNIPTAEATGDFEIVLESTKGLEEMRLQDLYTKCSPYVVNVLSYYDDKPGSYGLGTGIIIDESGYIVTNAHVISNADSCTVVLNDGTEHTALLVGEDAKTDLAVLKIKALGLTAAEFGDCDEMVVGDGVVAIGTPLSAEFAGTFTNGIISAFNRSVSYSGTDIPLIQTNTALNEGNSGGPLINMYGQVIGVTNLKMSNDYGVTIEGIAFAIPSTTVKTVVDSIIANGKVMGRPGIGITCGSVPEAAKEQYGLPDGLYITEVSEESDAKAKGILPGDVLTHINGEAVFTTEDVLKIRDEHKIGDSLRFTIYREGKTFEVDVEIYDISNIY
ncbi:MAG: trypsin-like peptidase domain-containing protein [Oscillospiraceae bacterium]|nr:trypsin-like peptidase domain-containing protein [Oscillospiraceae bacterium]